jgi:bacterioferritin-associated ferredoxin
MRNSHAIISPSNIRASDHVLHVDRQAAFAHRGSIAARVPSSKAKRNAAWYFSRLRAEARKRGGECLSPAYLGARVKLVFRCAKGHPWKAAPRHVQRGSWCPKCGRKKPEATIRANAFRRLKERVRERGGKCLSPTYLGHSTALTFSCAQGHLWVTKPRNILAGNWCGKCARTLKFGLERMQVLARKKGGRCLSTAYVHSQTKLRFTCAQGHTFRLSPACLSRGQWCGRCARLARRLTLAQMQAIARARGGECLSTKYVDSLRHLTWLCADGHMWRATSNAVRNSKTWCPQCKNGRTRAGERRDWIARKKTASPYARL